MNIIQLEKGQKLKVIGQKDTFVILENINGDVFNKLGANREEENLK